MKIRQYLLNEERLGNNDKRAIEKLIDRPKNTTFVLQSFAKDYDESEREVDVRKTKDGVSFEYNRDLYELTNILVDVCDSSGYTFKTEDEKPTNTTIFTVVK